MGKATAPKPLRWCTFRDGQGKRWTVDLTDSEIDYDSLTGPSGEPYAGCTLYDYHRIVVDLTEELWDQDVILLHEIMHVACNDSALRDELKEIRMKDKAGKAEEAVIRAVSTALYKILKQFGLRWPKKPAGVRAVRTRKVKLDD